MSRPTREHPALAVIDVVRPGWRERTARRKTPWNFLTVFLLFTLGSSIWYASFRLMWQVHVLLFPSHAGQLSQFWPGGLRLGPFVSSFLLAMPLGISSLMLGAIIANLLMWCIPPARRTFERQAVGCPEVGLRSIMLSFLRWGWVPVVIGFGFSFIGACTLRSLR
jgi:hypothetical protein